MSGPSEFEIQRALVIWQMGTPSKSPPYLPTKPVPMLPGVVWWHTPNGGARSAREGKAFKELGVIRGIFDMSYLWGGLYVLELKNAKGTLSDDQKDMWKRYEAAGAAGIAVANSLQSAKAQIIAWKLTQDC